jgi:hypothetical protein
MAALLGFMGNQAQAATVTISVDLGGTVVYSTTGAVSITALNGALAGAGSAYRFETNGLTASSTTTGTDTVSLATTGAIMIAAVGSTLPTLSVDVVASNILAPTGTNGMLSTSASGTYTNVAAGSTTYTGDYMGTTAAPISGSASGGTTSFQGSTPAMGVGTVLSGYSLSNSFVIGLSKSVGGTEGFSGSAVLTVSSVVPEPASVVMLLTGMPLPLAIVFGLIRRRRAVA